MEKSDIDNQRILEEHEKKKEIVKQTMLDLQKIGGITPDDIQFIISMCYAIAELSTCCNYKAYEFMMECINDSYNFYENDDESNS